jgi:hypothetical protein
MFFWPTGSYKRREIIAATGERYLRVHFSQRWLALAAICAGWLLLCTSAQASLFGVTLAADGGAGDAACAGSSFLLNLETNPIHPYANSATGYNDAPLCSDQLATSSVNATAALGALSATATADLSGAGGTLVPLPSATTTATWNDTFTANATAEYILDFTLNSSETATQSTCNTVQAQVTYYVFVTISNSTVAAANWNNTDCPLNSPGLEGITGNVLYSSNNNIEFGIALTAGTVFEVSTQLTASAQVTEQQSATASDNVTATVNSALFGITGPYTSASTEVYPIANPEPAPWLLTGTGLTALWLRARRRRALPRATKAE